jgi:hypothetical protein
VCPSVEQNEIDIFRILKEDGKYNWKCTCSTNGLYVFWKEKHLNLCGFFFSMKLAFLLFYGNFNISSYSKEHFLDQIKCILGFPMYPLIECNGLGTTLNSLIFLCHMTIQTVPASFGVVLLHLYYEMKKLMSHIHLKLLTYPGTM